MLRWAMWYMCLLFYYEFLNVFLYLAWIPDTEKNVTFRKWRSLSIQARRVWSGTSPISRQLKGVSSPRFYLRCSWNIFCRADDTSSNYCWLTTSNFRILWQVHFGSCHRSMSWNTITVKRPIISTEISIFH